MSTKEPTKNQNGKGGNFDTRTNPFLQRKERKGGAPEMLASIGLGGALDAAMRKGCAVLIGTTRDGGALVITILDGEERHRTYCATDEELDDAIRAMASMYEE